MSTEHLSSSISEVAVEEVTADLERSSLGCQVDIFARFADAQIIKYLAEDEDAIRSLRGRPVEFAKFRRDFFGNDAELNVESRSAALEWIRIIHISVAKIATRAFEGMDGLTNVMLDRADDLRRLDKHGRFYWTVLALSENLKMMLSLTNPNVVYSCFGFDATPRAENHLKLHFYDVDENTQKITYELVAQLLTIFDHMQMNTDPPPCVALPLENEDEDKKNV